MKAILLFIICVFAISIPSLFAQDEAQSKPNQGQAVLFNEVYLGYGAGGLFYWTGRMDHSSDYPSRLGNQTFSEPQSAGSVLLGYNRNLTKVIGVGFLFGLQNFSYSGVTTSELQTDYNDLLLSGIARVTFSYLNKPAIRMYSGVGLGITMCFGSATQPNKTFADRKLLPGGQLTLLGIRFGRAFGGFVEIGMGTIGIINAGLSYKFKD